MKKYGFVLLMGLAACGPGPSGGTAQKEAEKKYEQKVLYGEDNRIENYQAPESLKVLAASTVALVKSSSLVRNSQGKFDLLGGTFGDQYRLCASEPFREQTSGAFCSGSLVAPDLIMTAGHCVTSARDCSETRFVFDFAVTAPGVQARTFSESQVYSCREIVAREQINAGADYGFIRLDRPVGGRSPLAVKRQGELSVGDSLFVIGHPAGLPQKIAGGAQVRSIQSDFFTANLDTYGGNSGSAVFNANTRKIEGILVRGDSDFTWAGSCTVSNRCTDQSCRGEDVTRVDRLLKFIPETSVPSPDPSQLQQVFKVAAHLKIPDYPDAGVVSSVSVPSTPQGRKVQVQIDLVHTYRGDLVVELVSPSGQKVILHQRSGGSLDNIQGTFGSDLASVQSLDVLSRESQTGLWSLKVSDQAAIDAGTLNSWSLIFKK